MSIYLYRGGEKLVGRSGVGQAIRHQAECLSRCGLPVTDRFAPDTDAVHINTVLPDAVVTALLARLRGRKVVWYGHSTMEDFRGSFRGSDLLAPLFRRWLTFCYGLGDVVLTPTPYSRRLLAGYGLRKPVYSLSNGVDVDFFHPDAAAKDTFRKRYHLGANEKTVISVGHTIARKGLPEFLELARRMPDVRFLWFGWTDPRLVPAAITRAIRNAPPNVLFPGFVDRERLREAYQGADVFAFLSHEETEGIVVLEALACGTQVLCYDATAMPEIVTDEVGEVVPLGDIATLADAVRRLCAAPRSADACRARAADFEASKCFSAYLKLYENMYRHSPAWQAALEKAAGNAPAGGE